MPSFLPLKMNVFLAGMLIAAALKHPRKGWFFGMVALLAALPITGQYDHLHLIVRELLAIGFWALVHLRSFSLVDAVARLFSSRPAFWLGELSYSVYLIHLLFLHPVAAWAIGRFGAQISPPERFLIVVTLVAAASYGLAFLTYYGIERPGQQMGRTLLKSFTSRRFAGETQPESIAAP
jgi:peptidoglycan/LPS O-acetylase OafA/YrhL